MPTLKYPRLSVTTDRPRGRATVVVSCDLEFTDYEVHSMNMLGLRYTLGCHLLNMDMLYPETVITFDQQAFPSVFRATNSHQHVVFEAVALMRDLHSYIFGKDTLVAEPTLKNGETGAEVIARTGSVAVALT